MIKFEARYDQYAYRVSNRQVDPAITELHEGQWVTLNDQGLVTLSDGTKKSFICLTSRRTGRDNLSSTGMASYLLGAFELHTDQFDALGDYEAMTPLKVNKDGILTPWVAETDKAHLIAAYANGAPTNGYLHITVVS